MQLEMEAIPHIMDNFAIILHPDSTFKSYTNYTSPYYLFKAEQTPISRLTSINVNFYDEANAPFSEFTVLSFRLEATVNP